MHQSHIRNFAIIAHIDHGKSTLADRLLEITGTVSSRDMADQLLDSNPIERERGITIKLAPVRMRCSAKATCQQPSADSRQQTADIILNLIDTPGHVDFSYEVSRSLAACEGAILVVDATQGVQAQTLANLYQAKKHNLTIIPVINKIDLPNARIAETIAELVSLGFREEEMIQISAKTGQNVDAVLRAVVERIPPPSGNPDRPLRALVFSSQYDPHKGVVVFVRVVDGQIDGSSPGYSLRFIASGAEVSPIEIGYFTPKMTPGTSLSTGEVGYIATGLKDIRYAKVGDTVTTASSKQQAANSKQLTADSGQRLADSRQLTADSRPQTAFSSRQIADIVPLPGYQEPKPMVFLGLFPVSSDEFQSAREAMEKLRLSDSAFSFRPISSLALGNGFHCGFLGLLHAEVVQERLLREFGLTMIATAPSVEYHVVKKDGETLIIQSASEFPDPSVIETVKEPVMELTIFSPKRYVGAIMQLCQEKRGEYIDLQYLTQGQALRSESADPRASDLAKFTYLMPLSEMIVDFFDRLKSATEGYASLDYQFFEYHEVDVVKLDILVNKEKVDAFSTLVVRERARERGKYLVDKLAEAIPRQQFEVPIQAAIGGQIIARADVKAFRKDVIAKLYGGDRTRKDKLLDKQKKGKAKMKMIGKVEIPQSAFFAVLKRE